MKTSAETKLSRLIFKRDYRVELIKNCDKQIAKFKEQREQLLYQARCLDSQIAGEQLRAAVKKMKGATVYSGA